MKKRRKLARSIACALVLLASAQAWAEVTVSPERIAAVEMSNRDVNRIVCSQGVINDAFFSEEKGITVQNDGRNSFVKFLIKRDGISPDAYASHRAEFYVVCGGQVYTLMVTPKNIIGQTIRLVPGSADRIEDNLRLFGPQVEEDRAVSLSLSVLQDQIADSIRQSKIPYDQLQWVEDVIANARIAKRRDVQVEGIGLTLIEYWIRPAQDILLDEGMLLTPYFGESIFAITLESLNGKANRITRAFVVSRGARR